VLCNAADNNFRCGDDETRVVFGLFGGSPENFDFDDDAAPPPWPLAGLVAGF